MGPQEILNSALTLLRGPGRIGRCRELRERFSTPGNGHGYWRVTRHTLHGECPPISVQADTRIRPSRERSACGLLEERVLLLHTGLPWIICNRMVRAGAGREYHLATRSGNGSGRDTGPKCGKSVEARVCRWVSRWRRAMLAAALRLLDDDGDTAEDIVQEAVVKVLLIARRKPNVVEKVRDPCPWLVRVTKNMGSSPFLVGSRSRG